MSFALNTPISIDTLDAAKGYLTRALPDVKSSHRCEALARGLGFRTYAALLSAAKTEASRTVTVEARAFCGYLHDHGYSVSSIHLYRGCGLAALQAIHAANEKITTWGIGVGELQQKPDGRWETYQERHRRFLAERAEFVVDGNVEPFLLALALVNRIPATTTIRPGTGSYKLKHIAENYRASYPDGAPLGPVYVANGLVIAAALHAGFRCKTYVQESGFDGVNVSFNMSKRVIIDLDCEIRPNGAAAQARQRRKEFGPLLRYMSHIKSLDTP